MNIALLFNSDDPKFSGFYGWPIHRIVFGTRVLQDSRRQMKVSIGDVLIYSSAKTWEKYDNLTELVYFDDLWKIYVGDRLQKTFRSATVYSLVIQNCTKKIAKKLHVELESEVSYLGIKEVDFSYRPHLAFFRNMMIEKYRLNGDNASIFYSMSGEDGKDHSEIEEMLGWGFENVTWEDRGAHRTIFDDYDSLSHFKQIKSFVEVVSPHLKYGDDDASELVMMLEDLYPALFNVLGAAADALLRAENEEHVAQVGLSGRRYIEKLADILYPARNGKVDGRKVGQAEFRNRIWAFLSQNSGGMDHNVLRIGGLVDSVVEDFNACLHGDQSKGRVTIALTNAAVITLELLGMDPRGGRRPYLAFEKNLREFLKDVLSR